MSMVIRAISLVSITVALPWIIIIASLTLSGCSPVSTVDTMPGDTLAVVDLPMPALEYQISPTACYNDSQVVGMDSPKHKLSIPKLSVDSENFVTWTAAKTRARCARADGEIYCKNKTQDSVFFVDICNK